MRYIEAIALQKASTIRTAAFSTQTTSSPYALLGVKKNATEQEIKAAFYREALGVHPDTNDDPQAQELFGKLRDAYDVLRDQAKRNAYDSRSTFGARKRPRRPGFARSTTTSGETQGPQQAEVQQETLAQAQLRSHIEQSNLKSAVQAWMALGSPLDLCEYLLEQCRLTRQFPDGPVLAMLLEALHGSEALKIKTFKEEDEGAIAVFVERKTAVYNALIRVSNVCGDADTIFLIIDEMERRGIDKDMETLEVLSHRFSWQWECSGNGL